MRRTLKLWYGLRAQRAPVTNSDLGFISAFRSNINPSSSPRLKDLFNSHVFLNLILIRSFQLFHGNLEYCSWHRILRITCFNQNGVMLQAALPDHLIVSNPDC
jgi:hypothetical protein